MQINVHQQIKLGKDYNWSNWFSDFHSLMIVYPGTSKRSMAVLYCDYMARVNSGSDIICDMLEGNESVVTDIDFEL